MKPADSQLQAAAQVRQALAAGAVDAGRMLYVAGCAASTPCDIEIDDDAAARAASASSAPQPATAACPGKPGACPAFRTWYMAARRTATCARHEPAFEALRELLELGQTQRLPTVAPVTQRACRSALPWRRRPRRSIRTIEDLAAAAVGGSRRLRRGARRHLLNVHVALRQSGLHPECGGGWPLSGRHHHRRRGLSRSRARRPPARPSPARPVPGRGRHLRGVPQSGRQPRAPSSSGWAASARLTPGRLRRYADAGLPRLRRRATVERAARGRRGRARFAGHCVAAHRHRCRQHDGGKFAGGPARRRRRCQPPARRIGLRRQDHDRRGGVPRALRGPGDPGGAGAASGHERPVACRARRADLELRTLEGGRRRAYVRGGEGLGAAPADRRAGGRLPALRRCSPIWRGPRVRCSSPSAS
ncbi:MAG: hypothetical protein MZW92_52005 [Comamonadaceae bacterium]|nr:hypothetical protein [Comamonadaceae bacterium]